MSHIVTCVYSTETPLNGVPVQSQSSVLLLVHFDIISV